MQIRTRSATAADAHVGHRIRAARLESGISQTDLAVACGITFQQIQKYENGANRVASGRLEQIAQKLGRPPSWFFARSDKAGNGSDPASTPDRASLMAADRYGAEIIDAYLSLSPERRSLMRDVFGHRRGGRGLNMFADKVTWPEAPCCSAGDPDIPDCQCLPAERALRAWKDGAQMPAMTAEQRECCLDEIDRVEGYKRSEHEAAADGDLARTVLCAWVDYCRDKGLL